MTTEIKTELLRLEQQHEIKILYAVESGSRAWGFASADSDWDVRYIYIHKLDWYLNIDDNDFLEEKINFFNNYVTTLEHYNQPDTAKLNEVFRRTMREAWNE